MEDLESYTNSGLLLPDGTDEEEELQRQQEIIYLSSMKNLHDDIQKFNKNHPKYLKSLKTKRWKRPNMMEIVT